MADDDTQEDGDAEAPAKLSPAMDAGVRIVLAIIELLSKGADLTTKTVDLLKAFLWMVSIFAICAAIAYVANVSESIGQWPILQFFVDSLLEGATIFGDISIAIPAGVLVCILVAGGGRLYYLEASRRRIVKHSTKHLADLESLIDQNRTSSGLNKDGTHPPGRELSADRSDVRGEGDDDKT